MNAIERIISLVSKESTVLDIGCGGLSGENTTNYLIKRFENVTGVCRKNAEAQIYSELHPKINFVFGEFPNIPIKQYDLVVHDLNIESSLNLWENHLKIVEPFTKEYLLTYVMTTDQYGDPETPALLKKHWETFWHEYPPHREAIGRKLPEIKGWELVLAEQEERRSYITWLLLKRTSGI